MPADFSTRFTTMWLIYKLVVNIAVNEWNNIYFIFIVFYTLHSQSHSSPVGDGKATKPDLATASKTL